MANRKFQNIIFKDCGSRLNIDKVVEFETMIGHTLPEDFRQFLCEINGGVSIIRGFQCLSDPPPALGGNLDPEMIEQSKADEEHLNVLKSQVSGLGNIFGGFFNDFAGMMDAFGPSAQEEELFYRNSWRPHVVSYFYHLNRPIDDCITNYCRRAKILDEPDVRSLIPFASARDANLYLSICKDYFGCIYLGNYKVVTNPLKGIVSTNGSKKESLAKIENDLVARSFSEFLSRLFFAKMMLAEDYTPSEHFQINRINPYEDDPDDADLVIEDDLPDLAAAGTSDGFTASLKLEKLRLEEDDDVHIWKGRICLDGWTDFTEDENGWVSLQIESESESEIPDFVFKSLQDMLDKQEKLRNTVLRAAIKTLKTYDEFEPEEFVAPNDLIGSMTLSELRVFFFSKDYPIQIGYVLPCEWDEEHGFAVLMKENKVIDAGPEDSLFYH